jgi:glycosyltransferase involved in cell wall biosynthesis
MIAVHQVIPAANPGDAITNQAFAWRDLLAQWGHPGEIVAEHVHPDLLGRVHRFDRGGKRILEHGAVILRYAIWSKTAEAALADPPRAAVVYHNITPGHLLRAFNPTIADLCDAGRKALSTFPRPAALIADSTFNATDLSAAGLGEAAIVPLLLDDLPPDVEQNGRGPAPIVLHVGRIVPNKRLEDAIKGFALYQRHREPTATFVIVGWDTGFENYRLALERLAKRVDAESVIFTGAISREERDAWFQRAHVYLSMSVHEGFCAPVIEAIAHGVPVVARAAGAVPETLGGAGIVIESDDLPLYAEAMHEAVSSEATRKALTAAATGRLAELRPEAVAPRIKKALTPLLEGA